MIRLITAMLILLLPSCGLVRMPFRIAGNVTRGTAQAVKKPITAHKDRKARKQREKAKKEAEERKKKAMEERAAQTQSGGQLPPQLFPPQNDGISELQPIEPDLPPLPSEYQDPLPLPE